MVCLTSLLHISFTKPQAKNWRNIFLVSGLIYIHIPFSEFRISENRGFSLIKIWFVRCSRTKLLWFLSFFLSMETSFQRFHTIQICSLLPYKVSLWFENVEMSDFIRDGKELYTFDQAQKKARFTPDVLKFPLNSVKVLYIRICQSLSIEGFEGFKMWKTT